MSTVRLVPVAQPRLVNEGPFTATLTYRGEEVARSEGKRDGSRILAHFPIDATWDGLTVHSGDEVVGTWVVENGWSVTLFRGDDAIISIDLVSDTPSTASP